MAIEQVNVGRRVAVQTPHAEEDLQFGEDVDPATWRHLKLIAHKKEGGWCDIELLRPLWWLELQDVRSGGNVYIAVPEYGIDSDAEVLSVGPCPKIRSGNGKVVTGTFRHSSANTFDVSISGLEEPIGVTANHPFWSEDREEYIPAGQLNQGERVRTLQGLAQVTAIIPRAGPEPVYNLEIQVAHVYHVGSSGVLVHNGDVCVRGI